MKGIRVCLILCAVIISAVACNSQSAEEKFFQNNEMWSTEMSSDPMTEEESMMYKMFLAEDPVPAGSTPIPTPSPVPAGPTVWDNLISTFSKLTNNWGRIVETFKTTRSSEIKERLAGKGFEFFSQSAQIQITKGIKAQYIDQYIAHLATRIVVPPERRGDLAMVLEESKWADSNVWSAFNTLFSIDNGGNTKFASILVSRNDEKDTYDIVFSDIKADFKFAPDIMVVHKKLSVLGGIWVDDKDEQIRVPKTITPEDVSTVLQFFQIVAFKGFAEQFGIKLDFPKL